MKKVVLLIDAGYLQNIIKRKNYIYNPQTINTIAHSCCLKEDEELSKILYYDCEPFNPIDERTSKPYTYLQINNEKRKKNLTKKENKLIKLLAKKDLFAIRLGVLKFDGWDNDKPTFRQKGVDMRIGLDMAHLSHQSKIDRILLITGDTDFIPAMKYVRKSGIQIVLTKFPKTQLNDLLPHADFVRKLDLSELGLKTFCNEK